MYGEYPNGSKNLKLNYTAFCVVVLSVGILKLIQGKIFPRLLNNYLVWQVVHSFAPLLSEKFRDAHEDLIKVLTGSTRSEDLWKKCMANTDGAIGMALGKLFVDKVFDETSKQQVQSYTLVVFVSNNVNEKITPSDWLKTSAFFM